MKKNISQSLGIIQGIDSTGTALPRNNDANADGRTARLISVIFL